MPMYDPPHPGEMVRDVLEDEEVGWTVTECARRLGVARNTLSRLLHGRIGISPKMALALERAGWSSADHWMRIQAAWDLARARRELDAAQDVRLSWPYRPSAWLTRVAHQPPAADAAPEAAAGWEFVPISPTFVHSRAKGLIRRPKRMVAREFIPAVAVAMLCRPRILRRSRPRVLPHRHRRAQHA